MKKDVKKSLSELAAEINKAQLQSLKTALVKGGRSEASRPKAVPVYYHY